MTLSKEREQEYINMVRENPYFLKKVETQTPKICLEAVKENGRALQYVKNQTEEICLTAVKQNGRSLVYVKDQTEKICLEAIKESGRALRYVLNQTDKICLETIKEDVGALRYIKNQTEEICLRALFENNVYGDTDIVYQIYVRIQSPTTEMKKVERILRKGHLLPYRQIRYQLVNGELEVNDSPYHVLEKMYRR